VQFTTADINGILSATGEDALLTGQTGVAVTIKIKFRKTGIDMMGQLTDKPQALCSATVLDGLDTKNAVLTHGGTDYRMLKPLLDDAGFATVTLNRITT
jgi:hypothetical protein